MSHSRFEYDEALLAACSHSSLAVYVVQNPSLSSPSDLDANTSRNDDDVNGNDDACTLLHQQHAHHYGRPKPRAYTVKYDNNNNNNNNNNVEYVLDGRLQRFVESVLFVHKHNKHQHLQQHRVALNQFADEEFPTTFLVSLNRKLTEQDATFNAWEDSASLEVTALAKDWMVDLPPHIMEDIAANLTLGHGGMGHFDWHRRKPKKQQDNKRIQDAIAEKVKFPDRGDPHFALPYVDEDVDGDLLKVKPRYKVEKSLKTGNFETEDEFGTHLNWATDKNPDKVPIVKDAIDQGECGSCWAYAAAGSLEASVSRREARDAYMEYLEKASLRRDKQSIAAIHEKALDFARSVEKAAFQMANLSIQELIDCDTAADQGCIGGNPLLAFYFIHRYGLTSWSQYPYAGYEDNCHKKWVSRPVAKVKSWGIISPNHENHMELVLRFIGPIAVGVNGAERSFLAYQEGIFERPNCRQGANHALLIVGYGEEKTEDGDTVKYWIARNSWGTGWGENGFIRVKRGDGLKGTPGVCGIARSPSVALGGILLTNRHRLAPYHTPDFSEAGARPLSSSESTTICARLGFDSCASILDAFEDHRAFVLGFSGIFFAAILAVYPLTFHCRRRSQRRKARREILTKEGLRPVESFDEKPSGHTTPTTTPLPSPPPPPPLPTEADPLLGNRNATIYGDPFLGNRNATVYGDPLLGNRNATVYGSR